MIFSYIKSKFGKDENLPKSSKLLPNKFIIDRLVTIDETIEILTKGTSVKFPNTLSVKPIEFVNWELNGIDDFEDIILEDKKYKFLYDKTNNVLYFMQLVDISERKDVDNDSINFNGNIYEAVTDLMEVQQKRILLRIYERMLSSITAEYLFVEIDKKMLQKYWVGVIIEISMLS